MSKHTFHVLRFKPRQQVAVRDLQAIELSTDDCLRHRREEPQKGGQ